MDLIVKLICTGRSLAGRLKWKFQDSMEGNADFIIINLSLSINLYQRELLTKSLFYIILYTSSFTYYLLEEVKYGKAHQRLGEAAINHLGKRDTRRKRAPELQDNESQQTLRRSFSKLPGYMRCWPRFS